jgi:hypothetical protein
VVRAGIPPYGDCWSNGRSMIPMRLDPWSLPLPLDQRSTWGWIPDPCPYNWITDPHKVGSLISALTIGSTIPIRWDPCPYHWITLPNHWIKGPNKSNLMWIGDPVVRAGIRDPTSWGSWIQPHVDHWSSGKGRDQGSNLMGIIDLVVKAGIRDPALWGSLVQWICGKCVIVLNYDIPP